MPSIAAVSGQIAAAGLPVLFVDTCILLDVIRATKRRSRECVQRAHDLLALIAPSSPQCCLVVPSMVPIEWNARAPEVFDEVQAHFAEIEDQASYFHEACQVLGLPLSSGPIAYSQVGLAEKLRELSAQLLAHAVLLDADTDCTVRAVGRVVKNIPPSRRNGEVKDCAIIEECLEVCRQLKSAGFSKKRVFCTSNTDDYCDASKKLHSALASEFASVGLGFTKNLPWAVHEIQTP